MVSPFTAIALLATLSAFSLAQTVTNPPANPPLIGADVTAGILGAAGCGAGGVVGVQVSLDVPGVADVCVCVDVLAPAPGTSACPACPANSSPACGSGACTCQCAAGYDAGADGQCHLVTASQRHRSRRSVAFPAPVSFPAPFKLSSVPKDFNAERCPDGESACSIRGGGPDSWECLDTTTSLDSCGGCLSSGGINCLVIPGALAISCVASQCRVSTCFPGWRHLEGSGGRCVRSRTATS